MERILPYILATLTQKPRYQVEGLVFPKGQWISCLFRLFELVFWRRQGIRREAMVWSYFEDGVHYEGRQFYTVEALLAHGEQVVRNFFKSWEFEFVQVPTLVAVTDSGNAFQVPFMPHIKFAIAVGTSNTAYANGVTSQSVSLTVSGSNTFQVMNGGDDGPTMTATQNGVSLTAVAIPQNAGGSRTSQAFYLVAPATGTTTINFGSSTNGGLSSVYYTGVSQTGNPVQENHTSTTGASFTANIASVSFQNSWLVCTERDDQGGNPTGITGGHLVSGALNFVMMDSNGTVSSGSQSIAGNLSGSGTYCWNIIEMKEVGASGFTSIKTINGLAKASVKTVNGLAIASAKTFNGLS